MCKESIVHYIHTSSNAGSYSHVGTCIPKFADHPADWTYVCLLRLYLSVIAIPRCRGLINRSATDTCNRRDSFPSSLTPTSTQTPPASSSPETCERYLPGEFYQQYLTRSYLTPNPHLAAEVMGATMLDPDTSNVLGPGL